MCNAGIAAWLGAVYMIEIGCIDLPVNFSRHYVPSWVAMAILGSLSCCLGDTFASEFGTVLNTSRDPRLITTLKPVPRGNFFFYF